MVRDPDARHATDEQRLRWLLRFLRYDMTTVATHALLGLRNEVFEQLQEKQLATVTDFDQVVALGRVLPGEPGLKVVAALRDLLASLQQEIRQGMDGLRQLGQWQPFGLKGRAPQWSLERSADQTILRAYTGSWKTITLASAADLVVQWWPHLRCCERASCRIWFLPAHGRQRYHDGRCAAAARYERFKPTRNYKNEYAIRYSSTRGSTRSRSSRKRKPSK